jgi:hypothetical protein
MAYLNQQEREKLLNELKDMSFNKAKGKLRRLDPKGRLAYARNVQNSANRLYTRYDLPTLGVKITLVEAADFAPIESEMNPGALRRKTNLVEVIVEPTPDNKS